jgi:hypothetical protein
MMPSKNYVVLFGLLAASAAGVFLAFSIDHDFYAPGAHAFGESVDINALHGHVPRRFDRDLTPALVLRKLYSVGAFAIVGIFAAALLDGKRRALGCAALVAAFSAVIEVVQKLSGSKEGLGSNAFDVGCGAVGGLIGAGLFTGIQAIVMHYSARKTGA